MDLLATLPGRTTSGIFGKMMMRDTLLLTAAIFVSAFTIAGAILLRPTGFDRCLDIVSADINRQAGSATLDPKDVEAQAARICAGVVQ